MADQSGEPPAPPALWLEQMPALVDGRLSLADLDLAARICERDVAKGGTNLMTPLEFVEWLAYHVVRPGGRRRGRGRASC